MHNPVVEGALVWAHFGDLHVTGALEANYRDFLAIVETVNAQLADQVDFCVLPGDNADDGSPDQYDLIRRGLERLKIPVHVIPGDLNLDWECRCAAPTERFTLTVEATDAAGRTDSDTIVVATPGFRPPDRAADGSDADALDPWPERHLLGTRLGPNRNGRAW